MLEQIKKIVEDIFQLENIEKRTREDDYPRARSVFCILAREIKTDSTKRESGPKYTFQDIADIIKRDHSSVIYNIRKGKEEYIYEENFPKKLKECRRRVQIELVQGEIIQEYVSENDKLQDEILILKKKIEEIETSPVNIFNLYLSKMTHDQQNELLEYRVKPFARINKIEI